jgi:hypothetical protein
MEYASLRSQLETVQAKVYRCAENSTSRKWRVSEVARERSEKSFEKFHEARRTIEREDLNRATNLLS